MYFVHPEVVCHGYDKRETKSYEAGKAFKYCRGICMVAQRKLVCLYVLLQYIELHIRNSIPLQINVKFSSTYTSFTHWAVNRVFAKEEEKMKKHEVTFASAIIGRQ